LLRRLAIYSALGDALGIDEALHDSLESLRAYGTSQQAALLQALGRTVASQYGEQHGLARCLRDISISADRAIAASQLLDAPESLAQAFVEYFKLPQSHCKRDLTYLLRHLGLVQRGLYRQEELADWYWQRIGIFLQTETRHSLEVLFSKASKVLSKHFTPEQTSALEKLFLDLSRASKQWQGEALREVGEIFVITQT